MDGRGRTGKMIDLIHFCKKWMNDIMTGKFEIGMPYEMADIVFITGEQVVDTENIVPPADQGITEMAANKPRPTGHQNTRHAFSYAKP